MRDEPLKKCPKCGKAGVKRLVGGGAGLIFKGSGFYITDYRNKDSAAKEKRKAGGESKPAESKPAEAKPATPATTNKPAPSTTATAKK